MKHIIKPNAGKLAGVCLTMLVLLVLSTSSSYAFFTDSRPITVEQPDGRELHLFVSGDELYHWIHDEEKYTIVKNEAGFYVYAQLFGGLLMPSAHVVGDVDPATTGLTPGLKPGPEFFDKLREKYEKEHDHDENTEPFLKQARKSAANGKFGAATMDAIVVFIRFAGEEEFPAQRTTYQNHFNSNTNSLKKYYEWNSYGQLSITSHIVGGANSTIVSYQTPQNRSYYQVKSSTNPDGYDDSQEGARRKELFEGAYEAMHSLVPAELNLDANNDGYIDMIYFVINNGQDNYGNILWPHRSRIYSDVQTNGVVPRNYMCVFETWHDIGVLAHETGHVLGAPDFYRVGSDLTPVGFWETMANQTNPPQSMSAYVKHKYMGFIDHIPEITTSGTYTLSPVGSFPSAYKIASTSPDEFFVVEYRQKTASGFESLIPGSGLLIYRVNPTTRGNINAPDELYVYRELGTDTETNGNLSQAFFSSNSGRVTFNDLTSPNAFMSDGSLGHLNITNIGEAGNTISFTYTREYCDRSETEELVYTSSSNIPTYSHARIITNEGSVTINNGQTAHFFAEKVVLKPGFRALEGSSFRAELQDCADYQPIPDLINPSTGGIYSSHEHEDDEEITTEDEDKMLSFRLYPNPAQGSINVDFDGEQESIHSMQVYNTSGNIMTNISSGNIQDITEIDLAGYKPGMYILKVISDKNVVTKKFQVF